MLQILSVVTILVLTQTDPLSARTRYPYWQMVREVVEQIESRRPRPSSIAGSLQTPGQEYPFEAFRHLRTVDLLRAAREGAEEARQQAALGKPEAEVDALVRRNVAIALEYLPLLIKSDADVEELVTAMANRKEDPVLRTFILEHTAEGFAPRSLFSLALPSFIDANDKTYQERLMTMVSHPGEQPDIQELAIRVYFHRLREQYHRFFMSDPAVASAIEEGDALTHAAAVREDGPALSRETLDLLTRQGRRMELFAQNIAGHIAEGSVRDARVKAVTREVLEEIKATILGVNEAKLIAWLAGVPFEEEPGLPGFPGFPAPLPGTDAAQPEIPFPMMEGVTLLPTPGAAPF